MSLAWRIELTTPAKKQLAKLSRAEGKRITTYLRERLAGCDNPRALGKALTGPMRGLWRYRVGDYRLLCEIIDDRLIVLVLQIGHRRDIYR